MQPQPDEKYKFICIYYKIIKFVIRKLLTYYYKSAKVVAHVLLDIHNFWHTYYFLNRQ